MTLLKNCLFCGERLIIISSTESEDGHAHAECLDCKYKIRYLNIPSDTISLLIMEKTPNEA